MEMSSGIKLVDEDDEKILKLLAETYKENQELTVDSIFIGPHNISLYL